MLRLAGLEPQGGAKRDRHERLELHRRARPVGVLDDRRGRGVGLAVEREQGSPAPLAGEPLGPDGSRGRGAHENLARVGLVLEPDRGGRCRPRDHELSVTRLDEEEVTDPRVDARRHPEPHLADRAHRLARALDEPLHLRGRAAGSLGVRVAREENQQSVAAKLEDVASSTVRDPDQAFENAADRQHQLLGAGSTPRLEPLGEGSESGEVDRDERAVELAPGLGRRACCPVAHEPRQIWLEGCVARRVHSPAESTPSSRRSKGEGPFETE